jgi:NADH:ubiquinone oxidoreductase subunit E
MLNLGLAVEEAASGEPITGEAIDELALEQGVDASHLYAAAAVTTDVEFAREHEIAFVACGGVCQNWGALECIEHLALLRQERLDEGKPAFDIQAKSCLDKCEHAPAVMVVTPEGTALIARASKESLRQAVEQACD